MRKFLFSVIFLISSFVSYAQSHDDCISDAINTNDWFKLDSIYNVVSKDSISPFLETYSRGLIGHYLNRTDISIVAFSELLDTYSTDLDLNVLLNSAMMLAMDLSHNGNNKQAANLLDHILQITHKSLNSTWASVLKNYIEQYTVLSEHKPYTISFDGEQGRIPFRIVPVGNPKKKSVLMQLDDSSINGVKAAITFDTGAGVNIISESLARKLNLTPLKVRHTLTGIGKRKAHYAIADEMRIGNIVIKDVPFFITDITTENVEANQYVECFSIVVGSELMLCLKDMSIDFTTSEITIPSAPPSRSTAMANMCFSRSMNLLTKDKIHNDAMWIKIDTGDASYGSLNGKFFMDNKEYVLSHANLDTVRTAGIGGVRISECYRLPDIHLTLGGNTVVLPEINVYKDTTPLPSPDYECNLGLKSLMQFDKIRFNMVDFILTTVPVQQ